MTNKAASCLASSVAVLGLAAAMPAVALPTLQLDIQGGTYQGGSEESVVTHQNQFNLLGYCDKSKSACSDTYYLSMAIIGADGSSVAAGTDFGSFTLGGSAYSLANMIFGTPPIELWTGNPDQDLAPHDVFPTLYTERSFKFMDGIGTEGTRTSVNVQDDPGTDPTGPGPLAWESFAVDMSGLKDGYNLHFDLYSTVLRQIRRGGVVIGQDEQIKDFAPFSHDARAYGCTRGDNGSCGVVTVPEPGSMTLLGLGLAAGFVAARRRLAAGA